jgi:ribosome biogenesis ATPase
MTDDNNANNIDPKLNHIVRKYLSTVNTDQNVPPSAEKVADWMRKKYREYQRKELSRLTRQIQSVLTLVDEQQQNDDDDDEYDQEARAYDEHRAATTNGLNASLTKKYRKLQQERDEEDRALQAAETDEVDTAVGSKKRTRDDPLLEKRASKLVAGGGKLTKRKKSVKSASSSKSPASGAPDTTCEAVPRPSERYSDLGGMGDVLTQIRQLVEYPLVRPELYRHLGVDPPRGVLLRGPPGCGKTHLVNSIAGQLGVPYFRVSSPELVSGMSGESEARIRELFQAASDSAPSIVFLDELDAIAPKRNDGKGMEKRMVAQLLTCLDMLDPKNNRQMAPVIVMGATNRAESIDPALRRAGRFDKEILIGVPDEEGRIGILKTMTKDMKLSGDFDLKDLARRTPGYVGADVRSLTKEAAVIAINRIFKNVLVDQKLPSELVDENNDNPPPVAPLTPDEMEPLNITMEDFLSAVPKVQPSSKREGFATVPGVSWDDIGALGAVREELTLSVLEPIRNPEKFQALGIPLPAGVLLYGPPGCGKTLLAKAIANESGANFISVKGPELLDKYVGESERSVRLVFERARASSPCVVFFDELDSLCPKRGGDNSGGGVSERVVNQLLTEMDGLESRRSVFVIAATNRPELIDPAMMRPGRLDKLLYVSLPQPDDRVSILKAISSNITFSPKVDLDMIGRSTKAEGYSGADCAALLREAGLAVLKESYDRDAEKSPSDMEVDSENNEEPALCIRPHHFDYAFNHVVPSVSRKDQARYQRMRDRMAHARSRGAVIAEIEAVETENGEKPSDGTEGNTAAATGAAN